jgi:hypothetical protein
MKTCLRLWRYVPELFLEWEVFKAKFVEKFKSYVLCLITFHRK